MEQLFPISQQKADDDARLTALLDDIDEASRRADPNPGVGLGQILSMREDGEGLHIDYELNDAGREFLAEQARRSAAWIRDHYGPDGEFRCPCDREA